MQTKNVTWSISNKEYVVRNVPYQVIETEEFLALDVSIKLTALRDLMFENKIPQDVNFKDLDGIEL